MLCPDEDAEYERNYVNDAATLVPQVACPHHVDTMCRCDRGGRRAADAGVYIGSLHGRPHFRFAHRRAHVLKGRKAAKGLRF